MARLTYWIVISAIALARYAGAADDAIPASALSIEQQAGNVPLNVVPSAMDAETGTNAVTVDVNPGSAKSTVRNVEVSGFPTIQAGDWANIDWKMDGQNVTGTVHNRDGSVEGTFVGTVGASGITGTFTHQDGRVGAWSWNGNPPTSTQAPPD